MKKLLIALCITRSLFAMDDASKRQHVQGIIEKTLSIFNVKTEDISLACGKMLGSHFEEVLPDECIQSGYTNEQIAMLTVYRFSLVRNIYDFIIQSAQDTPRFSFSKRRKKLRESREDRERWISEAEKERRREGFQRRKNNKPAQYEYRVKNRTLS